MTVKELIEALKTMVAKGEVRWDSPVVVNRSGESRVLGDRDLRAMPDGVQTDEEDIEGSCLAVDTWD